MKQKHDTSSLSASCLRLLSIGAAGLLMASSGCASATLETPPGHPGRPDAPPAPQADPAAILLPNAPLPDVPANGEPGGMEHRHGEVEAPASAEPSRDENSHEMPGGHGGHGERSEPEENDVENDAAAEPQHQGHGS